MILLPYYSLNTIVYNSAMETGCVTCLPEIEKVSICTCLDDRGRTVVVTSRDLLITVVVTLHDVLKIAGAKIICYSEYWFIYSFSLQDKRK